MNEPFIYQWHTLMRSVDHERGQYLKIADRFPNTMDAEISTAVSHTLLCLYVKMQQIELDRIGQEKPWIEPKPFSISGAPVIR